MGTAGLRPEEIPNVDVLDEDDCWSLLAKQSIGRLAVRTQDGVDIFPVNFTVKGREVFIRSAPGSKLIDIASDSSVAFEVDGKRLRHSWSVVLKGQATRMSADSDIHDSGVLELRTLTSSAKWNYVRIAAGTITGRRFRT
jgi:uncharacterized protein